MTKEAVAGAKRGIEVILDPALNRSTAFSEAEKQALGLVGLVPDVTETEDLQLRRVMMQLGHKATDLDRYIFLMNLLDHDETLFYRTIMSDPRFLRSSTTRPPRGFCRSSTTRPSVKRASSSATSSEGRAACTCR